MKREEQMKFLSRSILLEGSGLSRINTWIILILFLCVTGFLYWASVMTLNETIVASGNIKQKNNQYSVQLIIPAESIMSLEVGQIVDITTAQKSNKYQFKGSVNGISSATSGTTTDKQYFDVTVDLSSGLEEQAYLRRMSDLSMQVNLEIIIGSRSILAYMLGPIINQ